MIPDCGPYTAPDTCPGCGHPGTITGGLLHTRCGCRCCLAPITPADAALIADHVLTPPTIQEPAMTTTTTAPRWSPADCAAQGHTPGDHTDPGDVATAEPVGVPVTCWGCNRATIQLHTDKRWREVPGGQPHTCTTCDRCRTGPDPDNGEVREWPAADGFIPGRYHRACGIRAAAAARART